MLEKPKIKSFSRYLRCNIEGILMPKKNAIVILACNIDVSDGLKDSVIETMTKIANNQKGNLKTVHIQFAKILSGENY